MITNWKQILESFLENIRHLADKKYQERIWLRAEGPQSDDIDDTIVDFFDDGDFIFREYKKFGISNAQIEKLNKLKEKIDNFKNKYNVYHPSKSTEELIKKPEWEEIRKLSKEVLIAFNFENFE